MTDLPASPSPPARGLWLSRLLRGEGPRHESFEVGAWIFLRALGFAFLCAFGSLWVQLTGLIGRSGILPAAELMARAGEQLGSDRWLRLPTLFWLGHSDGALRAACVLGVALSVCLLFGLLPRWSLLALWALYLSFCSVGGVFLSFQWDTLLLETGFFAVFLAPAGLRARWGRLAPRRGPLLLLRWLLAKLMLMSGLVKITSGDPTWRSLRALDYHYWTQPLPSGIGLDVVYLPPWFHHASVAAMFFIELVLPFLLFAPRRLRHAAAFGLTVLQLAIAATGNYGFFNVLALALCLSQLDDEAYKLLLTRAWRDRLPPHASLASRPRGVGSFAFAIFAAGVMAVGALEALERWDRPVDLPEFAETLLSRIAPFRTINGYGLFAVMTRRRVEIEVAGSDDGATWKPYGFRWKPGPVDRRPAFPGPHMPRLDWQMWFAALGTCDRNPWFVMFQWRLLQGSSDVLSLVQSNPFPAHPPRFIRSTRAQYRPPLTRTPDLYWQREEEGEYCPVLALDPAGNLIRAAGGS